MTLATYSSSMPVPVDELFEFHMNAANLPRISPRFPPVRLVSAAKRTEPGDLQVVVFGRGPLTTEWHARVTRAEPGRIIEDIQERGPFRRWRHQHRFGAVAGGSVLTDAIAFRLLPGTVGEFLEFYLVRPAIVAMFVLRHRKTRRLLADAKGG